jgi:hypothetical protein
MQPSHILPTSQFGQRAEGYDGGVVKRGTFLVGGSISE